MELSGATLQNIVKPRAKLFAGKVYDFARVNLVKAGCPVEISHSRENMAYGMPLVIAANRHKLGRLGDSSFYPESIIIAGAATRSRLLGEGRIHAYAWVERGAFTIKPENLVDTSVFMTALHNVLSPKGGMYAASSVRPRPYIHEILPFHQAVLFSYGGKGTVYRQSYLIDSGTREVRLSGVATMTACGTPMSGPTDNGARYASAVSPANNQTMSKGAPGSELVSMLSHNWNDVHDAVDTFLDCVKHGCYKPMQPSFYPVNITDEHHIGTKLAAAAMSIFDFARWSAEAKPKKTKSHSGVSVPMSKHAYVGDKDDPSTWKLPIDTPGRAQNALARMNQTQGIPQSAKPGILQKIRRAASSKGVDVSTKPTSGQKDWTSAYEGAF